MKIVQLVTQMEAGGAQRVAMLLLETLQKQGYEAEVWFLYLKRPTYANIPGVKVLWEQKPSGLDYIKIAVRLKSLLDSYKPDIFISHTHYSNVLGQFLARLTNVSKRIAVQHNPLFTYPKIVDLIDWILGTTAFYTVNVAVSQTVVDSADRYPQQYRKKLVKIYNGIPLQNSDNVYKQVRNKWRLPENAPLLINVARLAKQKNQAVLFEALLHLPDAHLVLVGEGELRSDLESKVTDLKLQKRVHFLGELESQDVSALLSICDIFVFPSLYEAMPMAVIEAMSSGLPLVVSNIPAMQEMVGNSGILVSPDNVEELAGALKKVLNSLSLRNYMRRLSLERVKSFSLQTMVESYERLWLH